MFILMILLLILSPDVSYPSASTSATLSGNINVAQYIVININVTQQMLMPTFDAGAPPPSWVRSSYSGPVGSGHNATVNVSGLPNGTCFCRLHTDVSTYTNGTTTYTLYVNDVTGGGSIGSNVSTHTTMSGSSMDFTLEGYFNSSTNATSGNYSGTGSFSVTIDGTNCC